MYLLVYLLPFNDIVNYFLLILPRMFLSMIVIILIARLFGQDQVVVIADKMDQITSSEWL
jgi:hypothetical protein